MDYKIDDNVKISGLSLTDNEIRTLARKVIDSEQIIRSVVIITSSQKKWEEWNNSAISEKFIFLRAHSVHQLLRSGLFKDQKMFIFLDHSYECSDLSFKKILSNRIEGSFAFYFSCEKLSEGTLNQFTSIVSNLDLNTRIDQTTTSFLDATKSNETQLLGKMNNSSPDIDDRGLIFRKSKTLISQKIKKVLSESPEEFLRHAVNEIKEKKTDR